jgi:hypothetical protein
MIWCAEDCVVIVLKKSIILVGPGVSQPVHAAKRGCVVCPEFDGFRLITNEKNELIRRFAFFKFLFKIYPIIFFLDVNNVM